MLLANVGVSTETLSCCLLRMLEYHSALPGICMTTKVEKRDSSSARDWRNDEKGLFLEIYAMLEASLKRKLAGAVLWKR